MLPLCVAIYTIVEKLFYFFSFALKKTPTQVFSSEICKILKNTYFEEHLRTTTSIPTRPSSFISSTEKLGIVQELKTFQVGASLRMTAKCNNHMTKKSSFQLFITTLSNENIPEVL